MVLKTWIFFFFCGPDPVKYQLPSISYLQICQICESVTQPPEHRASIHQFYLDSVFVILKFQSFVTII